MSRHLKLIAAVAVVLVAISGFSPNRKGGGSRSSGGGCSSSSSSSHSSSSSYDSDYGSSGGDTGSSGGSSYGSDRDDGYSASGGGSRRSGRYYGTSGSAGSNSQRGTGSVERCAARSGGKAKAVVEVDNPNRSVKTYRVTVRFVDASGGFVDSGSGQATVPGRGETSVDVPMRHPGRLADVSDCIVEKVEPVR